MLENALMIGVLAFLPSIILFMFVGQPYLRGSRMKLAASTLGFEFTRSVPRDEAVAAGYLCKQKKYSVHNVVHGSRGAIRFALFDAWITSGSQTRLAEGLLRVELDLEVPEFEMQPRTFANRVVELMIRAIRVLSAKAREELGQAWPEVALRTPPQFDELFLLKTPHARAVADLFAHGLADLCVSNEGATIQAQGRCVWLSYSQKATPPLPRFVEQGLAVAD